RHPGWPGDGGSDVCSSDLNVGEVELHPVSEADFIAAADRPQAGQARFHAQPAALPALVTAHFLGEGRAGANEAHMSLQDIKELRKLINAAAADDFADESDPRVAGRFENRSVHFVERFEFDRSEERRV